MQTVEPGHRLASHTADCIIEAWGPDRPSCVAEALSALVEIFASAPDDPATGVLPLRVDTGSQEDQFVSLLEDVIYTVEVLAVLPVRFHLTETDEGGLAGAMEVVPLSTAEPRGPSPKAVSYHGLAVDRSRLGWRCRALIDV